MLRVHHLLTMSVHSVNNHPPYSPDRSTGSPFLVIRLRVL